MSATCIICGQPFTFGLKGKPGVNIYSDAGWRETRITGMCELCFDEVTAEPEEEDDDSPRDGGPF